MAKQAKVVIRNRKGRHPQGGPQKADMVLKAGEKGTGHDIQVVHYWPWSPQSVDKAEDIIHEAAEAGGYEIV